VGGGRGNEVLVASDFDFNQSRRQFINLEIGVGSRGKRLHKRNLESKKNKKLRRLTRRHSSVIPWGVIP